MQAPAINIRTKKHPLPQRNKIQVDTAVQGSTMAQYEAGEMAELELGGVGNPT